MTIQVNSDKTITVDARLTRFIESEVSRVLARFAAGVTRVEVHLSDVDGRKRGQADRRCVVEVRPAGARPLSASATAPTIAVAIGAALGKARRSLSASFGRKGWAAVASTSAPATKARAVKAKTVKTKAVKSKAVAKKGTPRKVAPKKAASRKVAGRKATATVSRGPKKKAIFQARRKAWPTR